MTDGMRLGRWRTGLAGDDLRAGRRREGRPADDALMCADALDATARRLRAGMSLSAALDATVLAGGAPAALGEAVASHARGRALAPSLASAHRLVAGRTAGDPAAVHLMLGVLTVAAEHGGAPAESLDRAAASLRERDALRADATAQAAAARLSTAVLTVAPIVFSAGAAVLDPGVRDVLVHSSLGWAVVTVGLTLNLLGRRWMNRIVTDVMGVARWAP